jgi:hypothetical protein
LAARATAELERRFADEGIDGPYPEGVAASPVNYASWWLTPDALVVGFPAGQVQAYALGDQTVEIPWRDLRALLAADGPVAALAGER